MSETNRQFVEVMMHKIFGTKEDKEYKDRIGAYIIPVKGNEVGVVETPKGYFLLGGGLDADETDSKIPHGFLRPGSRCWI